MDQSGGQQRVVNEYRLNEDNELRLEVGKDEVILELLEGTAEIFGSQISMHKRYTLPPGFRAAVFTYKGALVEVVGRTDSAYIAQQTPMLNTHAALDTLRKNAEAQLTADRNSTARGPRLLIAGPTDVGKSTLCRILCNYAVREGRTPLYVELDIGQGSVSIPGTIGCLYIEKPADIVDGFDRKAAYVHNFGHISPSANIRLYDLLVKELALAVRKKSKSSLVCDVSGFIVNTCGWVKGDGYACIVNAAEAFEPDVVIVLDHERLYNELQQDLPSFVKILHLPKSGGVESRSQEIRTAGRRNAMHRYFYGTKSSPFYPHSFELSYDKAADEQELLLAKVGAEQLPASCVPVGMVLEDHRTQVVPVPVGPQLLNHVLALMPPNSAIDQGLLKKPCIGFVVVTAPYPLPTKVALFSEVTFIDDSNL
uniref:Protein CLP1 homolog n=1 Tax=Globodera rostochiensis TaxID=31243 RepID=A0A914GTW9_GLORO